jgi:hypothetical protein
MNTAKRLFVAVSTRQQVANLPPLVEHARKGDNVVWIESREARRTLGGYRLLGA